MTKPTLLFSAAVLALFAVACGTPDSTEDPVDTRAAEVRATSAQSALAAKFRADVGALPDGSTGWGRGRCTSVGTRPKLTFTVYFPKVSSPGMNVVVGTRFEAPGTPTQELLLEGKEYPIVFRGDAYGVTLAIGTKKYVLEVYETEGMLMSGDGETSVPLRCDYE